MNPPDLQRTGDTPPAGTLFDATSRLAGEAAAKSIGSRREKILRYLTDRGPATLFELAAHYGYYDHQISGRLTELARDGLIERSGERRTKPQTGCVADVWRLTAKAADPAKELADLLGYPLSISIPGDGRFQRWTMLERDDAPGVPYVMHEDSAGLRLRYRVALIECDGCGRPVKAVAEQVNGQSRKVYRCGTPGCHSTWHLVNVMPPGGPEMLALVMKSL
jgi:DNA-binding HxlR family transcriptional regulator